MSFSSYLLAVIVIIIIIIIIIIIDEIDFGSINFCVLCQNTVFPGGVLAAKEGTGKLKV